MKLRLDRNSIRLRVKKSDLEKLGDKNFVNETVSFPNGSFNYRLSISENEHDVTARMEGPFIEVIIPSNDALLWMNNDETGIYRTITFNNHNVDIIIEKDFPCKDKSEASNADTFTELAEKNQMKPC